MAVHADEKAAVALTSYGVLLEQTGAIAGDADLAISFDGVNDYMDGATTAYPFAGVASFTAVLWIKPGAQGAFVYPVLLSKEFSDAGGRQSWSIFLNSQGGAGLDHMLSCERWLNATNDKVTATTNLQSSAIYHQAAIVYTGSNLLAYLDGAQEATVASTKSLLSSASPITFGSNPGGGSRFYAGLMDEPVIYPRALSATEIRDLYNAGRSPATIRPIWLRAMRRPGLRFR